MCTVSVLQDVEYSVGHRGKHFYITLRDSERPNSELRLAPMDTPEQQTVGEDEGGAVHSST